MLGELIPDAHVVRFDEGEALPEVADLSGLVVLGGNQNAYDPTLAAVADLLRAATEARVPTLGICLGAQLLATSHGGRVEVNAPAGPERGIIEIRTRPGADADPILGAAVEALGREFCAVSMHSDAVTELPAGATWLAASRQYPYQAFRVGSALGVQFHPEVDADMYGSWLHKETGTPTEQSREEWHLREEGLRTLIESIAAGFATTALAKSA